MVRVNTFSIYERIVKPLRGHGIGDHWPFNVIVQNTEAKLTAHQDVMLEVNNYKLRIQGLPGGIATQLLRTKTYEPFTTRILKELLPEVSDAIDVGANIGYYTLLMSKLVFGHVWAFEPEKANVQALRANITLNHRDNVTVYSCAVSNDCGYGILHVSGLESGEHSLVARRHCTREQDTVITTLDTLADRPIGLIKIDTEGNDFNVLLGAKHLMATHPKLVVITEFWPQGIALSGHTPREFWVFLLEHFRRINIIDETSKQVIVGDLREAVTRSMKGISVNLLCTNGG